MLISSKSSSQVNYSVEALTGNGGLTFVGDENKLQSEVFDAFTKMQKAALKEGVSIQIVSAYRSFERQNKIWNRKYKAYILQGLSPEKAIEKIVGYSTLPGTSRHHWGTDIDIVDGLKTQPTNVLRTSNYKNGGLFADLKKWMDKNAQKFGFYLVYSNKTTRKGFKYEPWHYSYKSIAKPMLKQFISIDFSSSINLNNLEGFKFITPEFIEKYTKENILDINPQLK